MCSWTVAAHTYVQPVRQKDAILQNNVSRKAPKTRHLVHILPPIPNNNLSNKTHQPCMLAWHLSSALRMHPPAAACISPDQINSYLSLAPPRIQKFGVVQARFTPAGTMRARMALMLCMLLTGMDDDCRCRPSASPPPHPPMTRIHWRGARTTGQICCPI